MVVKAESYNEAFGGVMEFIMEGISVQYKEDVQCD